jgi:hypothetical protein
MSSVLGTVRASETVAEVVLVVVANGGNERVGLLAMSFVLAVG